MQEAFVFRHAVEHRQELLRPHEALLVPDDFDSQDRVLRAQLVELNGGFEPDQPAFRLGNALKPVGQRFPVEVFGVVEFDFA